MKAVSTEARKGDGSPRVEVIGVVSHPSCLLGTKVKFSARAAGTLKAEPAPSSSSRTAQSTELGQQHTHHWETYDKYLSPAQLQNYRIQICLLTQPR